MPVMLDFLLVLIVFFLTFYSFRLIPVVSSYRNLHTYIQAQLANFPTMYAGYTWLGAVKKDQGRKYCALEAYQDGMKCRPADYRLRNNTAVLLTELGYLEEAIANYQMIVDGLCNVPEGEEDRVKVMALAKMKEIRDFADVCKVQKENAIIEEAKRLRRGGGIPIIRAA